MTLALQPTTLDLGVPGFGYADLHEPSRLRALYEAFAREVERDDAELWRQWAAYRTNPPARGPQPRYPCYW